MTKTLTMITHHVYPPIPDRRWDWVAHWDGDEESPWRYGWGKTEAEAIADLKRLDVEFAEEEAELYEGADEMEEDPTC